MTSNFQHQEPSWRDAFCKSVPEPQHGQKADKDAARKADKPVPKRRPAH
ncbi:hypothetical protein [Caulobacter sp. NIBR1757]|nr:hypothetical protein [Caulobacter sp. NIBR1757]WGM39074.1 hypothetical protein AMEJIAPC_01987 [Caulobacter sp. NIBR1757]